MNECRLTLERGDGQCVDIGPIPDLSHPVGVARLLVAIAEAERRCGWYSPDRFEWEPNVLDFHVKEP